MAKALARATHSAAPPFAIGVFRRVLVPVLAMRLPRAETFTSIQIDRVSDGLKVVRIDARSIATKMINDEPIRDRSSFSFVGEPVRLPVLAFEFQMPIAMRVDGTEPDETPTIGLWDRAVE